MDYSIRTTLPAADFHAAATVVYSEVMIDRPSRDVPRVALAIVLAVGAVSGRHEGRACAAETVEDAAAPCSIPAARVVHTIFRQPEIEDHAVGECVIGEEKPSSERFYVRLANIGDQAEIDSVAWDLGRYTGFQPATGASLASYQRGPRQASEGTAVQVRGREIGIWIDSDHPRPHRGALIPVCPGYWWWDLDRAPWPFREPGRELSFSFDLKVPTATRQGNAEVYICAYLLFRERKTNRQFWFGASLFDPRGADRFPDTVHLDDWEGGTGLPILFSALDRRSDWLDPGPDSAEFADHTFEQYRRFDVRVGAAGLQAAITALKKRLPTAVDASEDPADYQLIHFNVNPEVSAPAGSRGQIGLALRDIRVVMLEP